MASLFNSLTGFGRSPEFNHLLVAPYNLHARIQELIAREADHARAGRPARILAKMNNLVDKTTIDNLYAASQAGVRIDLIVRGTCCLVPGVKGLSENIRVRASSAAIWSMRGRSISRIMAASRWCSRAAPTGCPAISSAASRCSSPSRRPTSAAALLDELLPREFQDNEKARELHANGAYLPVARPDGEPAFSAQAYFAAAAQGPADGGG